MQWSIFSGTYGWRYQHSQLGSTAYCHALTILFVGVVSIRTGAFKAKHF